MAAAFCNEGLLFIIIGIIGIIDGFRLNRVSLAANDAYGPGLYLVILSFVMVIGGVYFFVSSLKKIDQKTGSLSFQIGTASLAIITMFIYSILVPYIGYLISTAAFILAAIRLFGEKSWVRSILITGVSAAAFWLLFVYLAGIPLP